MTTNDHPKSGVCPRCGDTRLIPIGDGYSVNPCPNCSGKVVKVSIEAEAEIEASLFYSGHVAQRAFIKGYVRAATLYERRLRSALAAYRRLIEFTMTPGAGQQPAQPPRLLAKHQPCGCIVCTCEDDLRCHGCGAKNCGTHPVGQIPNAVYEQPAQPGSGEVRVRRFWAEDLPSMDVEVVFAQDFDRLQSALAAAKAYSDDLETRYHTAHERLTAAQREIAAITDMVQAQRDCKPPYTSWSPAGMHQMLVQLHDLILKEPS